jgi:hypothetical protein
MKHVCTAITLGLILAACGSSENLSYEIDQYGCKTGKHEFDSLQAYCDGLKSSSLNGGKGCAYEGRKQFFEAKCSGAFVETQ